MQMGEQSIKNTVIQYIKQISEENDHPIAEVLGHQSIVEDLGMASLEIATLISFLGADLDVDPFSNNTIAITDIRTVDDLCEAYEKASTEKTKVP